MAGTIERKCGAAAPSGAALIAVMLAEPVRKTGESSSSESSARRAGHKKQMGEPDHMPASIRYGQNSGASASPPIAELALETGLRDLTAFACLI